MIRTHFDDLWRIDDEAVLAKTGKAWEEWYALLDAQHPAGPDPLRFLREDYDLSRWWAGVIAARYACLRGSGDQYTSV